MSRQIPVTLTNMCMIRDGDRILVQERIDPDWPGVTFPGGHVESGESFAASVIREVFEETGLRLPFQEGFRTEDEYDLAEKPGTRKRVVYFLAEYCGGPIVLREGEIRGARFLTYKQAKECFEHEGTRRVLAEAMEYLNQLHEEA